MNCDWCDQPFEPLTAKSDKFCSTECRRFNYGATRAGGGHPADVVPEVEAEGHGAARSIIRSISPDGFSYWST